eukprot:Rhum_TRINITY_DN16534_c0_g1::Rhum_TRINITY_DN16534_c0_g1_i1::g.163578::m.163578/K19400/LZTFL1; leucine zipper transcription factor-like protein 1
MSIDAMLDKRLAGMTPHSRSLIGSTAEAFKSQKATHAKELEHELGRYTKTMLHDGVYSHRDVETLLSSFFTALQGTIQRELRSQTNVSAELLVQLFQCAHAKSLSLDPPRIQGALGGTTPAFLQKSGGLSPVNKLASLQSATSGDAKINAELTIVEQENARHQEKIRRITEQFQEMMQAKARVGAELSAARGEINALKDKHGDAKPEEIASLKSQISKLKQSNEAAKKELGLRLNESPQFVNLKKMITKKNDDLAKLREKLRTHELVYADDEDDPDF